MSPEAGDTDDCPDWGLGGRGRGVLGAGSRQRPGMMPSILQTPRQRWPGPKVSTEAVKPHLASVLIYQEIRESGPVHPCIIQDRQADERRSPSLDFPRV